MRSEEDDVPGDLQGRARLLREAGRSGDRHVGFGGRWTWGSVLAPFLTSCMTPGK